MRLADRFGIPVLTFVDTPGAYPGVEAEERGQAEAIARCIEIGLELRVPFIASVIGEGGSGGAVALASADRVLMLEHAIYSVISPEGCASILWRSERTRRRSGRGAQADGGGPSRPRRDRPRHRRTAGRRAPQPRRRPSRRSARRWMRPSAISRASTEARSAALAGNASWPSGGSFSPPAGVSPEPARVSAGCLGLGAAAVEHRVRYSRRAACGPGRRGRTPP